MTARRAPLFSLIGFGVLAAVLGVLGVNSADAAPPTACGAPGKAPCPLQALMRAQLARPYALRRFEELSSNVGALVALNPDPAKWRDWDELAREASRAASGHDEVATLRACTQCHRTYRRDYVERYRARELMTR